MQGTSEHQEGGKLTMPKGAETPEGQTAALCIEMLQNDPSVHSMASSLGNSQHKQQVQGCKPSSVLS